MAMAIRCSAGACGPAQGPLDPARVAQGQGPALWGGGAKNRKGQNLGLNMRLLLAYDRLSTLDHEGSDQPPQRQRPKMVYKESNQPKTKLKATTPCGHPAQVLRRVLRRVQSPQDPAPCTLRNILANINYNHCIIL
eukprot:scaffold20628_cov112-Isochrysis_galbana.AAC.5